MTNRTIFRHEATIMDACCAINLHESGYLADILRTIPNPMIIAEYVQTEELRNFNLTPLINLGLLSIATLDSEQEAEDALNFMGATRMDAGEAATGAIALHRNWAIATDDAAAIFFFERRTPQLQLLSTPEIIKYWVDTANPPLETVRTALQNVELYANFRPYKTHPLHSWWQTHK